MYSRNEKTRFAVAREAMVRLHLKGRNITDTAVLKVMGEIAREEFIPQKYISEAYADCPVPIGIGQTISQPYIVALMTQFLRLNNECEVLEIGTGSGYQTAILCKLAGRVYTIERFEQLSAAAQAVLGRLGIDNVEFAIGDGSKGWIEERQFDRILVTAAVPEMPEPLVAQLVNGGLIVAPVGGRFTQKLTVYEKNQDKISEKVICDCRFVRLFGEHGYCKE